MEVTEIGAPGTKKATMLSLCHKCLPLLLFVLCLLCV